MTDLGRVIRNWIQMEKSEISNTYYLKEGNKKVFKRDKETFKGRGKVDSEFKDAIIVKSNQSYKWDNIFTLM